MEGKYRTGFPNIGGFRTYNLWVDKQEAKRDWDTYWDETEIADVLENPRYAGLKGRYFKSAGNKEYQKMARALPITHVVDYANTMMRPVYTDFTETSENEEFALFSGKFYYQLFIQETIYVSYNVFETTTPTYTETIEKNAKTIAAIKEKGGFDAWVKLDEDEYSTNTDFMHIDTNLVCSFPKWRKQFAVCKGGAVQQNNGVNGLNLSAMELMLTNYLDQCIRLVGKKIVLTTDGDSKEHSRRLSGMLTSFENFIHLNLHDLTSLDPIDAFKGQDLLAIKDTMYFYLDRLKFEYGRVSNTNPKGERLTSGENYKDISSIANRQKETLEYLISFAYQAKRLWNIHLEFAVSGIPEKEAVRTVAHTAQTPNMEKPTMGQIEGTATRPPVGMPSGRKSNKSQQGRN